MRDRIRSRGVDVFGHLDHGLCKSIYFAGPEGLCLEISTSEGQAIDPEAWIDPEVVALAGISAAELERYKSPAPFVQPERPIGRPAHDRAKPRLAFPPRVYEAIFQASDEEITARMSHTAPPVERAAQV
jgi:hypothetical protein